VSALAATLAGVFVFKGTPSVIDALLLPRILIYAVSTRRPAPEFLTFILIYTHFAQLRLTFSRDLRLLDRRIAPI
jgi:hypothetical protein